MKTAKDVAAEAFIAENIEHAITAVSDFEADVRADERVKATADAYDRMSHVMVPRNGGQS